MRPRHTLKWGAVTLLQAFAAVVAANAGHEVAAWLNIVGAGIALSAM